MRTTERIQEWLADRVTWVQYPRVQAQPRTVNRPGFMQGLRDGMNGVEQYEPARPKIPRGLPQTPLGTMFAMGVVFGWFVVFLCIGIPVLWICYEALKTILFGS